MNSLENIVCAVWMVTYNHEYFIEEAISSVVNQQTDFKFKLFIGEDQSTDATAAICRQFAEKYPGLIELVINGNNIGAHNNGVKTYERCFQSGAKYVALLEGDDYWINPKKLQKQVSFLENNDDYAICFHRVFELRRGEFKELADLNNSTNEETYTIDDLASGNFIHTPSVVFRNGMFSKFPSWFNESPVGDYVLHMLNARHGKIKYFPEAMAVYRKHAGGVWGTKSQLYQSERWNWMLEQLIIEFDNHKIQKILQYQKANNELTIAECYKSEGREDEYWHWLHKSLANSPEFFKDWVKKYGVFTQEQPASPQPSRSWFGRFVNKEKKK